MKKLKTIFIVVIMVFNITACNSGRGQIINTGHTKNLSEIIIECFNNENEKNLVEIFSPCIQENDDLEKNIKKAFYEVEGKIISYEVLSYGYDGSIRDGKWVIKNEQVKIYDIITDKGEEYIIDYSEYIINNDRTKEGVYELFLRDTEYNIIQKMGGFTKE